MNTTKRYISHMETKTLIYIASGALSGLAACNAKSGGDSESPPDYDGIRPNIVYILADDLGYGDVSCLNENSKIHTKNIDDLASKGMCFTDAHSNSAVCTPTRYGILTGRYAWRTELKHGVLYGFDNHLIEPERMTVASYLKAKGYKTACIGKWHLGMDWQKDNAGNPLPFESIKNGPNSNGFDYFFGISASLDIPPYFYIENDKITATRIDTIEAAEKPAFWRKGQIGDDFKHVEVLPKITEKAVNYIHQQADSEKPFFLYFPLPAPHTPIIPTPEYQDKSNLSVYGDFILMVDDVTGKIMAALKEESITNNTLVIFTSDNGFSPAANTKEQESEGHYPSYIYRGYKADIFEGGHRVPFIVNWPDKIKAGTISDETVCLSDMLATCAGLFNETLPDNAGEDSYNILPVLLGEEYEPPVREATVLHSINGSFALRKEDWKMIFCPGSGGWSSPIPKEASKMDLPSLQLYNLSSDVAEKNNVSANHPKIVEKLTKLMRSYIENGRSTPGEKQENDPYEKEWHQIETIISPNNE